MLMGKRFGNFATANTKGKEDLAAYGGAGLTAWLNNRCFAGMECGSRLIRHHGTETESWDLDMKRNMQTSEMEIQKRQGVAGKNRLREEPEGRGRAPGRDSFRDAEPFFATEEATADDLELADEEQSPASEAAESGQAPDDT